jgi:predicted small integral membrane protein
MSASAGGAAVSGLLSITATKILALTLGPPAVAMLQSLQQARQTAVIAATANGQTALVQGASSLKNADRERYVRTVASIFMVGTLLAAIALWTAPRPILERIGLISIDATVRNWLVLAVVLTCAYGFLTDTGPAANRRAGRFGGARLSGGADGNFHRLNGGRFGGCQRLRGIHRRLEKSRSLSRLVVSNAWLV